jgi:hypothetical protein
MHADYVLTSLFLPIYYLAISFKDGRHYCNYGRWWICFHRPHGHCFVSQSRHKDLHLQLIPFFWFRNQLWAVTSAVGAVLCFFVVLVIFGLGFHRSSRVHLDRVSFRVLKWALVAKYVRLQPESERRSIVLLTSMGIYSMFFGIFSAIGGSLTGPGFLCGFSIFVLQVSDLS